MTEKKKKSPHSLVPADSSGLISHQNEKLFFFKVHQQESENNPLNGKKIFVNYISANRFLSKKLLKLNNKK